MRKTGSTARIRRRVSLASLTLALLATLSFCGERKVQYENHPLNQHKYERQYPTQANLPLAEYFGTQGVLIYQPNDNKANSPVRLLNHDLTVYAEINFLEDSLTLNARKFAVNDDGDTLQAKSGFSPLEFYADFSLLHFEVVKLTGLHAKVLINSGDTVTKLLDNSQELFKYQDWQTYFTGTMLDWDNKANPLKTAPADSARPEPWIDDSDIIYLVKSITGDWLYVECGDACGISCPPTAPKGWIRWRNRDRLLVTLYFAC